MSRYRYGLIMVLLLLSLSFGLWHFTTGQAQDTGDPLVVLNEDNIKKATVLIMQVSDRGSIPIINCVGTGTIVNARGLILTNAHLVQQTNDCRSDRIVIALTIRVDEPPVPTYNAEVVELNQAYNLAVLRITSYLDGRLIEGNTLQLPFVELGNSSQVELDSTLYFFGYQDIENNIVQVQRGTVSGFTAEKQVGERAWIRTEANLPGLMSGGGAYNRDGRLVGIPTILPERVAGTVVDCRRVYDTNVDGQIDNRDSCIPIGGPISAMRPSRLARGLVQAATLGIQPGPSRSLYEDPPIAASPDISNLFIATGINEAEMPINVVQIAPTGISNLYLFFDYANMVNGMIYELRTTVDGRREGALNLPPVLWNGGSRGLWYIGVSAPTLPVGLYEFTLFIEGRQVASRSFLVGGSTSGDPQFSDLVFGIDSPLGNLVGTNYIVPEGNIIRARFAYRNMAPGIAWRFQWYLEGVPLAGEGGSGTLTWESQESQGIYTNLAISSQDGFISGTYRLALFIQPNPNAEFQLAALSDFIVAGGAGGANNAEAQIFSDFRFAQGQQASQPINLVSGNFAANVPAVYIFFNWRQLAPGTPWTYRWLVDNDILLEEHTRWPVENDGENFYLSLVGSPTLPDARYTLEIEINGIRLTSNVSAGVGLGQLPVGAFASATGIQLAGTVIDAETGQGIRDALFIVLRSDLSVEDFTWNANQVFGRAQTDRNGFFQVPILLPRGTDELPLLYSILVHAEGYYPANADGIAVTNSTRSPLEIEIVMNRD